MPQMRTINEQRHRSLSKAARVWAVSFWERTPFLFPFLVPLRCLRLAAARQILSLGTALALLGFAVPNAVAQQFASRNPDKDIVTSGIGLGNKTPRGIWVDEKEEVLLVLDFRHKKIFTYCFDTGRRLDSHQEGHRGR